MASGMTYVGYGYGEQSIFADMHGTLELTDITILSGENVLYAGTCLGKVEASSKYAKWDTNATDGRQNLKGILGCDVDATSGDVNAFMYVHGSFNKAKLSADQAITAGSYAYGSIVIKEEY
jgi:hypothetical protein